MKKPAFILCLLCILAFQNLTPSIGQVISAADYGLKDFEIDAQGSMFIMHEELDAFYLKVPDECDYEIVANEFIFRGNKILPSKNHPADSETGPVFNFTSSRNILIEKNEYLWEEPAVIQADQWTTGIKLKGNKGFERYKTNNKN